MELLNILKNMDFTEYEAKAYLALLSESPLTGYAVAKNSGVPRSKIYEVLDNLIARGDVIVSLGDTPLYKALPAKEMIASRKTKISETFNVAEIALKQFEQAADDRENIWNITGHSAIIQKINECILSSQKRILIEIWAEDFPDIATSLEIAATNGVDIKIIAYGDINAPYASVYAHDMSDKITSEYGGRWIVFSADDKEVVAGAVSLGNESRAAFTKHQGLVMPITEVVIHDLYIAEIMNAHRDILEQTFGKDLIKLREKFTINPDNKKHYI